MGRPAGWMKELTGRSAMKSPGKPSHRREVELWFWREIAKGLSSEDAAAAVGVSSAAGVRWFRERGGMATLLRDPVSCRYLCFAEREEIALLRGEGKGVREIARDRPVAVDDLARAAAQRGDAGRQARVPGFGGAVEGRAGGAPAQDSQARCRRSVARVRSGPPRRQGPPTRRERGGGAGDQAVEGSQQAASSGSTVGDGVEPRADLGQAAR